MPRWHRASANGEEGQRREAVSGDAKTGEFRDYSKGKTLKYCSGLTQTLSFKQQENLLSFLFRVFKIKGFTNREKFGQFWTTKNLSFRKKAVWTLSHREYQNEAFSHFQTKTFPSRKCENEVFWHVKKFSFTTFLAESIWQTQSASMYKSFRPWNFQLVDNCVHDRAWLSFGSFEACGVWSIRGDIHLLNPLALLLLGKTHFAPHAEGPASLWAITRGRSWREVEVPPLRADIPYAKSPSSSSSLCPERRTEGPALCLEPSPRLAAGISY